MREEKTIMVHALISSLLGSVSQNCRFPENIQFFAMNFELLITLSPYLLLLQYSNLLGLSLSFDWYTTCSNKFRCGEITEVDFPFWGDGRPENCGYRNLKLGCERNKTTIEIMGVKYQVQEIDQESKTLKIARVDYLNGLCSPQFGNTTLDTELFDYAPASGDITILYGCSSQMNSVISGGFNCSSSGRGIIVPGNTSENISNLGDGLDYCRSRVIARVPDPVRSYAGIMNSTMIEEALREGYPVEYKVDFDACEECQKSNGVCGYDWNSNQTTCYCRNDQSPGLKACPTTSQSGDTLGTPPNSTGIAATVSGITMLSIVIVWYCKSECILSKATVFGKRDKGDEFDVEGFIRNHGSFAPSRYSFATVKKMTSSFAQKIGKGGFGAVFKGKLPDGRLVAVKMLNESKSNGEEFINEVASIGRTSHVNIVTLLGFCCERKKRALVYEYMPNGSLDNFIFNEESLNADCRLEWKRLYDIAIGIARGLEYLHRGCNTRILHFDIKPQNILLDEDFCPKISDFGLAKLWLTKESIVSMEGARGTIGYIAPEVFSRSYGGVSHKSDVYSYGMLVLEMVGGRKNFDSAVSHTSEIYYPNRIYKDLETGNEASILGNMTEEEKDISKKMILVSFWCIQTNPADRPSMSKVVEMLEGSLQFIENPPKPYLFSPPRSPQQSTTHSL